MNVRRIYLFAVGMRNLGFSTTFTLMAVYLIRELGVNPVQLVLPATAYEATQFLFEVPTGVVADVYSRRLSVIIGYVLLGMGMMLTGSIVRYEMVVMGMIVAGIGTTFISGALSAWIVDEIGQEAASQAFLQSAQIRLIVSLIGIILSVALGSISLNLALMSGGVIIMLAAVVLFFFMPETGFQRIPASERESWKDLFKTFRQGATFVRTRRMILWIFIVTFLVGGFGEAFGILWQAHILNAVTLPSLGELTDIVWFGILNAMFVPIGLIATELVRRRVTLTDNNAVVRVLTLVFVGVIVSVLLFALSQIFVLMVLALWFNRMLMTMASPLIEAWTNQHIRSDVRATVLSIQGQVNSLGEIAGGPVVGFIGTLTPVRFALSLSALILLPLIPVFNRSHLPSTRPN